MDPCNEEFAETDLLPTLGTTRPFTTEQVLPLFACSSSGASVSIFKLLVQLFARLIVR
jgi:hypothetical protein